MSSEQGDTPAHDPWPNRAYAWYVVFVLTLAYAFAILDRVAISLLVGPIKADLQISDTQVGLLQGLAFAICYTTFGLVLGYIVDRWSRRRLLSIGILVWSIATIACGLARNFGALFVARVGVGIGEASVSPASSSLIADYFPPERRAKAYSVYMLGSSVGTGMSYLVGGAAILLAEWLGHNSTGWLSGLKTWQLAFLLVGIPGVLVSVLFFATVKEPARRERLTPGVRSHNWSAVLSCLRQEWRAYATLMLGLVVTMAGIYASIAWNATTFVRERHWPAPKVAAVFALYNVPVGMAGSLLAGFLMTWMLKRRMNDAPIWIAAAAATATAVSGSAMALTDNSTLALAYYFPYCLTANWTYVAALTGLNNITPNELRGQVTAVFTLLTGLISLSFGSSAVGLFSDHVFAHDGGLRQSLAAVFALAGGIGLVILMVGRRAYRRVADDARGRMEANGPG